MAFMAMHHPWRLWSLAAENRDRFHEDRWVDRRKKSILRAIEGFGEKSPETLTKRKIVLFATPSMDWL
jgi:hypothetical protein